MLSCLSKSIFVMLPNNHENAAIIVAIPRTSPKSRFNLYICHNIKRAIKSIALVKIDDM